MKTYARFRCYWEPSPEGGRHDTIDEFVETRLPRYERWRQGTAGFPLVDAGMRELSETGWMHHRARMVTASFLVKHLHLDCRHRLPEWETDTYPEPVLDLAAGSADARERFRAASR